MRELSRKVGCRSHQKGALHMTYYPKPSARTQSRTLPKGRSFPRQRRRRSRRLLPLALLGLLLFGSGFLLGSTRVPSPLSQPEERTDLPAQIAQEPIASSTSPGSPAQAADKDTWELLLVNAEHPLPEDFQVPELTALRGGHAIDSRAYPALQQMMDDCRAARLGADDLLFLPYPGQAGGAV